MQGCVTRRSPALAVCRTLTSLKLRVVVLDLPIEGGWGRTSGGAQGDTLSRVSTVPAALSPRLQSLPRVFQKLESQELNKDKVPRDQGLT